MNNCIEATPPKHSLHLWREKVYPKQLQWWHPYQCPSKIHHAGFQMNASVRYIWTTRHVSVRRNKYPNCWMLSISTALSDRLAHKHRFNWVFPLCLVCLDLQFRWGPNWPLWKRVSVVAWVVLIPPRRVSSFLSFLSPATCTNTPVEIFDGNTTPNISLLAMIAFAMLVSIASTSS